MLECVGKKVGRERRGREESDSGTEAAEGRGEDDRTK